MSITGHQLREEFLRYFETMPGAGHQRVASAPLVPPDDPTVMFTIAGMVQFKRFYSGEIDPLPYTRATSSQKVLRAGGKDSDLENVGKTLRHHTFFEMLGNFSFGDYFKREAIRWGWQFVRENMGLPRERLFPTIFEEDDEAAQLWGEETDALYEPVRLNAKENFWGPAGGTGACGPCSEICFFTGTDEELAEVRALAQESDDKAQKYLATRIVEEGDRFLEIWNMVFPQFDQQRDGSRPILKNRGIDTGAGLERMTTAMMLIEGRAASPFETDLLWPIVERAAELMNVSYVRILDQVQPDPEIDRVRTAVNAVADHMRALCFCLCEGITPGNVGRGYVVRRIQRRALRYSSLMGKQEAFMADLVDPVIDTMGAAYPELKEHRDYIRKAIRGEEESFLRTRDRGIKLLDESLVDAVRQSGDAIAKLKDVVVKETGDRATEIWDRLVEGQKSALREVELAIAETRRGSGETLTNLIRKASRAEKQTLEQIRSHFPEAVDRIEDEIKDLFKITIPGREAFKLWDTYGFPLDMTREIAEDADIEVDLEGYEEALREQKERGRASWQGEGIETEAELVEPLYEKHGPTKFTGYDPELPPAESSVLAIVADGRLVESIEAGQRANVVINRSPFYAEAGGQVGDTGTILGQFEAEFEVMDTQKTGAGIILHRGELQSGVLRAGDAVTAQVDRERRLAIRRNHSVTHLLQAALKRHVGKHVTQAGSWVGPTGMRFDFSHPEAVDSVTLRKVQDDVNRLILADLPVTTEVMALEEARKRGAIAPFGEKYGPTVRVVQMGEGEERASLEFCGGTHLERTGQVARFRIVSEGSIAAGVRRIEGVTGEAAVQAELEDQYDVLQPLQATLASKGPALVERVHSLSDRVKQLEKELTRERQKAATSNLDQYASGAKAIGEAGRYKVATALVENMAANELRTLAMSLQEKLGDAGIAIAASVSDGKAAIVTAVGKEAQNDFPAGKVVNAIAVPMGGRGGGKPNIAQAGAKDVTNAREVLDQAADLIAKA